MTPEGKVVKDIVNFLKNNHILHGRTQSSSVKNGESDYWALYKGIYMRFEAKRPDGGVMTLLQQKKLETINENGGIGVPINDVSQIKDIIDMVEEYYPNSAIIDKHKELYGDMYVKQKRF